MRIQTADGRKLKYASERLTRKKMMTMAEVIRRYLDGHGVNYKLHVVNGPTMTAQDAANQLHVPLDTIIKSILFTDEKQTPILAILTGDKRADRKKLASVVGASKVRIGTPEATRELAGFEVGVMPPVAHKNRIVTVIDQKVMSFNKVYGGSGTAEALMEIDPHDISRLTDAKVADISE
jgi:Cys-tRNA(Pro) deacylase